MLMYLFKCGHSFIYSISYLVKKPMNYDGGYFKTRGTPLMHLLMYPYFVIFGQVSEAF